MQQQRACNHLGLAGHAVYIEPGAWPRQRRRFGAEQRAGHGRRRRGVADAHFAADEKLGIHALGVFRALPPGTQRLRQLLMAHGGVPGKVRGARAQMQIQDTLQRTGIDNRAEVYDLQRRAQMPRQHTDGRAATRKVAYHLGRYGLRKRGYTFGRDAVIGREHRHVHPLHRRARRALHGGKLDGERLQTPERARRLGELCLPMLGFSASNEIQRCAGCAHPFADGRHNRRDVRDTCLRATRRYGSPTRFARSSCRMSRRVCVCGFVVHADGFPFRKWGRPAMVRITRSLSCAMSW